MSCKKCEEAQVIGLAFYYRWKNANVEMRGCKKHIMEIFNALTKVQIDKKPKEDPRD